MGDATDGARLSVEGGRALGITRRALLGGIGASAAGAALAWGLPSGVRAAAPPGGTLTYGMSLDVDETLDPQVTNWISVIRVTSNICESLVLQPVMGRFVPGLAESWQVAPDAKTYTFKLKRGVVFHDGTPFTAEAVRFTLDRVVDPATKAGASHDALGPYDHTEVVDDHTARVVMKQGFAPLLGSLATGALGIVSPDAVKKMGPAGFARHPVGTGPFMFKEWVAQDHITVVRNPAYKWGSSYYKHSGPAYLDQMIYKVILEPAVRTGTLKSGETQYIDDVDVGQYDALRHDGRVVVIDQGQTGSGETILLNTSTGPTADPQVRVAIEYAIDREGLNQSVYHGLNKVAWSPLMRPTFGYDPATEKMYGYNPDKARATLDAAGWKAGAGGIREKNGEKLAIAWPIIGRPTDKAIAESVQASLQAVGIDVQVTPLERAAYYDLVRSNRYHFNLMWFSSGDPDVLRTLFHSSNVTAFNRAKYQVPEVDKMLDDAVATSVPAARAQLYARIQQRVLHDAAVVPMVDTITHDAKRASLRGEHLDALATTAWFYDAQV